MATSCLLLVSFLLIHAHAKVNVKVGMLNLGGKVLNPISRRYLFPAAQIAMETVAGDYENFQMSLVNTNECCTRPVRSTGALAASMYLEKRVDAFLGPALSDDTMPVADMAAYWNLPVISGASTSTLLGDKARFRTLVRTSPSLSLAAGFIFAGLKQYDTKDCVILRGFLDQNLYFSNNFPDAIFKSLEEYGVTVSEVYADQYKTIEEAIAAAAFISKFVILSTTSVRDIMVQAHGMGLTDGPLPHVFMTWYPFDYIGWPIDSQYENLDAEAIEAMKALRVLRMHIPDTDEYRAFHDKLRGRYLALYGEEEIGESYFAAATYDAVRMYAEVINEIMAEGGDVRDGGAVTQKMRNRKFQGVTGSVRINENGDRYGVGELLQLTDKAKGTFTVVGNYDEATGLLKPLK